MRSIFHIAWLLAYGLFVCCLLEAQAETRRALLVGIDLYQPTEATESPRAAGTTTEAQGVASPPPPRTLRGTWNLDGAVNDVEAIQAILVARYGFRPEHVRVLKNGEATRERILAAIRQHLIAPAAPGDISVFYYAGHGSQMTNVQSTELDQKDETIVPVDAFQGVQDIRDKEFRRLFNDVLDNGASLVAFFDSCHSGSITRGLLRDETPRVLLPAPSDPRQAIGLEPVDPRPDPEARGALVFSAAQDFQVAAEATDDERGTPHGAFSLALLRVLRTVSVQESAQDIFLRVKTVMQSQGRAQEPVLAGPGERRLKPLFGGEGDGVSGRTMVAVLAVTQEGKIDLQGGLAVGLRPHSELSKAGQPAGEPAVRVRVTKVHGLSRATAQVIEGDGTTVRVGDLFEVDGWVVPQAAALRVWLPPATLPAQDVERLAREWSTLRTSDRMHWVEDPTEDTPTHVLAWKGSTWTLTGPGGEVEDLGKTPSAQAVLARVRAGGQAKAKVFIHLPPPPELTTRMTIDAGNASRAVEVTTSPQSAHYLLVGRIHGENVHYAWVLPNITREEAEATSLLPVRTDWVMARDAQGSFDAAARQLRAFALRLGKVRAWLQLEAPPDQGQFPYKLGLKQPQIGTITTTGTVLAGDTFRLVLHADAQALKGGVEKRYVYVFTIDSYGNSVLLFPRSGQGNVENYLPYAIEGQGPPPPEIPLGTAFKVGPPFGRDTYLLLTSRETIPDPDVLESQGVRLREKQPETPLAQLLYGIAEEGRGVELPTPVTWSIVRLSLTSAPR